MIERLENAGLGFFVKDDKCPQKLGKSNLLMECFSTYSEHKPTVHVYINLHSQC